MPGTLYTTRGRLVVPVLLIAVLLTTLGPVSFAAPTHHTLDHFDTPQALLTAQLGTPDASSVSGVDILGGERDMQVTVTSAPTANPTARVEAADGLLLHSQDSQVTGQSLVQWDGVDGSMTLNDTGLGNYDLTEAGAHNGFGLTVEENDRETNLILTVYSGANASAYTLALPGSQTVPTDYYIPFAAFTTQAGSGADFTKVGAITLLIDGYISASDVTIHELRAVAFDWGDLPDGYGTTYAANGPRHVVGTLYLGPTIDPNEINGLPTVPANGDDTSGSDDEDGVTPTPGIFWAQGLNRGSVDVIVSGGPGCLSAWIDWNNNGNLTDMGDNVISNVLMPSGMTTRTFHVPVDPGNGTFYARFRLYAPDAGGVCTTARTPTGQVVNGEVEDYRWSLGPNAVGLQSFSASGAPVGLPVALPVLGLVASAAALFFGLRRGLRG